MVRKSVSLRWKAARKYNGLEDTPAVRSILPDVWEFLEALMEGLPIGSLPVGRPTLKRVASREGVVVIYAIGRPAPTDPDSHADYFIEDFWPEGDSSSN